MSEISQILFLVSDSLLIPDIIVLLVLFVRALLLVGSFINPLEVITENELTSSFHFMQRIYSIAMDGNYSRKFKKCDYVFFHNLSNIGVLDTKMLERAYHYGYEQTNQQIELIKSLLVTD